MSVESDVAVIDLPVMDRSARARINRVVKRIWLFFCGLWLILSAIKPFALALLALFVIDKIVLVSKATEYLWFHVPNLESQPYLRLVMSTNPVILQAVRYDIPRPAFYAIAICKMLLGGILWYYAGKGGAKVVEQKGWKWLKRSVEWLSNSHHSIILLAVCVFTIGEAWLPPLIGSALFFCNPNAISGAAGVKLRYFVPAKALAGFAFVVIFLKYGSSIY